ncbi:type IA DNA topoisomerase [Priestia flexa]|uniref:type IA DNA topoisomerase n=1 Tax=Priestia flexa TaxID=86664 RepID=UPI00077CAED2|nr:type IA DNA topoisomerase [Priestia flexa]MED4587876.1 DNA topoisomerase 3 [Priestia flexa]
MKPALLCEKPAQARTYSECYEHKKHKDHIEIMPCNTFPNGAIVVWAIGHLAELAPPEKYKDEWKKWNIDALPLIPEKFQYIVSKEKVSHFKSVSEKLKKSSFIVICTDPAREGEAIARTLILLCGCGRKPLKRFWCSSMTADAIRKAFDNLRDAKEFDSLYEESKARAYSDWLIGINTTRALSILLNKKISEVNEGGFTKNTLYSAGRVQSPLLFLIHQREKEIENFKPENFWEIFGDFSANSIKYRGKLQNEEQNRFKDKQVALATIETLKGKPAVIDNVENKEKKVRPPKLHNLSSLQAKLNKKYKLSPKDVLSLVQSLYEEGYCSYPRSSSQFLPKDEAEQLPHTLEQLATLGPYKELIESKEKTNIVDDKHFTDNEKVDDHYAIVITNKVPNLTNLSKDQLNVYDEIARSTIAAFYTDHIYNQTTIHTKIENYNFKSTGNQIINNGWKTVWNEKEESDEKEENQRLPIVESGQSISILKLNIKDGITKPPKPYTEGNLITLMATAGRKSHYDSNEITKTELVNYGSLGTEATRSSIVTSLQSRGYIIVKNNIVQITPKGKILIAALDKTILSSAELTAKWELYLQEVGKGNKSGAKFIEQSKALATKLVNDAVKNANTWKIDHLVNKMEQQNHIGKCPNCGKAIIDKKVFFGCVGYKEGCKFTLPKEILGKKISETNVKRLIEKGKSGVIKGLKGKKTFDAHLIIKDKKEGQLGFEFPKQNVTAKSK